MPSREQLEGAAEVQKRLANLSPYASKDECIAALRRIANELARELLATRWRPITETDLPKVGDELWSEKNGVGDFAHFCTNRRRQLDKQLQACGWTHFRSNGTPPARTDKEE